MDYPELKKYPHLAGNFGTAWQSQTERSLKNIPAPILFTNKLPYAIGDLVTKDRVYTTSVVGYEDIKHISANKDGHKDFTPIIKQSLELGGYETRQKYEWY